MSIYHVLLGELIGVSGLSELSGVVSGFRIVLVTVITVNIIVDSVPEIALNIVSVVVIVVVTENHEIKEKENPSVIDSVLRAGSLEDLEDAEEIVVDLTLDDTEMDLADPELELVEIRI